METTYRKPDSKAMKQFAFEIMNMLNVSFLVSNGGREFRFDSQIDGQPVILYTTTGTWIHRGRTTQNNEKWDEEAIKEGIRACIRRHVNENL